MKLLLGMATAAQLALAGCSAGSSAGTTTGSLPLRRTSATTTSASASGSGSGSGSGGGGSTGSSTGGSVGTTGGPSCPATPSQSLDDCDAGQIEQRFLAVDSISGQAIAGSLDFSDLSDPGSTAQVAVCGGFYFCTAPGHDLVVELTASGYIPTLFGDLHSTFSQYWGPQVIFSEAALPEIEQEVAPGGPTVDATLPFVYVTVLATDEGCKAGWRFTLVDLDGGIIASDSAFISGEQFTAGSTQTTSRGSALLYNVSNSDTRATLSGSYDGGGGSDGGACTFRGYTGQFTGGLHLLGGYMTRSAFQVD